MKRTSLVENTPIRWRDECGCVEEQPERSECEATTDNRGASEPSRRQSTSRDLSYPNRRGKDEEELGEKS